MQTDFIKSKTEMEINIENAELFYTDLNADKIYIKLGTNKNEIFGALTLKKQFIGKKIYYCINIVVVEAKHLRKGVVKFLYKQALELNFSLLSDSTHTTFGSKDIWQKFPTYFPEKNIFIINIETLHKRKFINQKEYEIWGKEENEDFDLNENEDKIYLIEEFYKSKDITKHQKDFFIKNIKYLTDKKNIRLSLE